MEYQPLSTSRYVFTSTTEIPNENVFKLYKEGFTFVVSYGSDNTNPHSTFVAMSANSANGSASNTDIYLYMYTASQDDRSYVPSVSKVTIDGQQYIGTYASTYKKNLGSVGTSNQRYMQGTLKALVYKVDTQTVILTQKTINGAVRKDGSSSTGAYGILMATIAKASADLVLSIWFEPAE